LCFRLLFQRADNLLAEVLGVGSHAGSLTQFSLYTQSETALTVTDTISATVTEQSNIQSRTVKPSLPENPQPVMNETRASTTNVR